MSQYTSYYLYQKYVKYGDQDWLPAYPNVFSADGDGTMSPVIKQDDDPGCGYTPPAQYRWVDLDPDTDYYCLDCGTDGVKISGTYGSGETFSVNCDSSTTLSSADTEAYSGITYSIIGSCVTEIGANALQGKAALSGVSIPSTVTTIGSSAFTNSNALIDCSLPESITTIGDAAFMGCISLSNIVLWDSVTSIGTSAFSNCDSIISINISTGLTIISESCFRDCGALSDITIPSGITSIGNDAFRNCTGIVSITVLPLTPPTLGTDSFYNTNNCPIYVLASAVDTYKAASGWSLYSSRIRAITS